MARSETLSVTRMNDNQLLGSHSAVNMDDLVDQDCRVDGAKSQCLIAVLEDAMDQLAVLEDIIPENERIDTHGRALNNEINRIVRERDDLQNRYQTVIKEQPELKVLANKSKFKENRKMVDNISNEFSQTAQALARSLRSHPSVAQNLRKIQLERGNFQNLILKLLRDLKDGDFNGLRNYVKEEHQKRNSLHMTIQREKKAAELLKQLQSDLSSEVSVFEKEMSDRNQAIQQLKDTIQEINVLTMSEQKYIKKEMKARESSFKQKCSQKELELTEEKATIIKKIEAENNAHKKIMSFLLVQKDDLERQIQEWMTRHEEDIEKKTAELESLRSQRAQDLEKFEQLVNQYEESEKFVEEYKSNKKREEEIRSLLEKQVRSVLMIQKWWRKTMERMKSNSKGKKGKKKSAKKKK